MRNDVLKWLEGHPTRKRPSKETLNHPKLIKLSSGIDPFTNTPEAFRIAYEKLGIDIINVVPEENAPEPLKPGQVKYLHDGNVQEGYYGLYNSSSRVRFPFQNIDDFWITDFSHSSYTDLYLPGAQYKMPFTKEAIEKKDRLIEDAGLYYYQYYTTLFMWGVEYLGWEIFMSAAIMDQVKFDKHFLEPVFNKTKRDLKLLCEVSLPWVFCHDDIAMRSGPIFDPEWYRTYIFPRYKELWQMIHDKGKKIIYVTDGNIDWALEDIRLTGCDGIMFESPSTSLDKAIDIWGDALLIGGIDAAALSNKKPEDVRIHTEEVIRKTMKCMGFALSCSGGLAGNIPLKNLEMYFDVRAHYGFTPEDWRSIR